MGRVICRWGVENNSDHPFSHEDLKDGLRDALERMKLDLDDPVCDKFINANLRWTLFFGVPNTAINAENRVLTTIDRSLPFEDMTEGDADLIVERLQAALDEVAAGKATQ